MPKKNKTKRKINKKEKKENFNTTLKRSFRESIDYIKESRNYIYFIIALFFLSGIIGFFYTENLAFLDEVIKGLGDKTKGLSPAELTGFIMQNNILAAFSGMIFGVFFGIFPVFIALFNDLLVGYVYALASEASSLLIIWMLVPHGIFELPAIFIALGLGTKLGTFLLSAKDKEKGIISLIIALLIFIPLATAALLIIEFLRSTDLIGNFLFSILAIISILALFILSISIGEKALSKEDKKRVNKNLSIRFKKSFKVFFLIVIPLLIIAAIIEGLLIFLT